MMKKLLLLTSLLTLTLTQAQVSLVKDINTTLGNNGNGVATYPNNRIAFNNHLVFAALETQTVGMELWITDGTANGTTLLKDILTTSSSEPKNFIIWQNEVIFTAHQNGMSSGQNNLFRTNLTTSGTLNMKSGFNFYTAPYTFNDKLFIGRETFYLAQNINSSLDPTGLSSPISVSSDPPTYLGVINNEVIYRNTATLFNGSEIWKTNFTFSGTSLIKDINPGNAASIPDNFIIFNNKGYFTADNGENGRELWVTDGTSAGTNMVLDLYAGATGSNPTDLTVYNNALYFAADHPTLGKEIFKMTTAQSITNLKNIASGSASSNPQHLFVFNDVLYFSADDGVNGNELWISEGFPSNTVLLKDINTSPSTPDSNPSGFIEYFGELYFAANDGVNGRELWKTNGTGTGTVIVENINPSGDSNPSDFVVANNMLFFSANNGTSGIELFKYQDASLSANDVSLEKNISLFPNVANDFFKISSLKKIATVAVYSSLGKLVKSFEPQDEYAISELSSGVYYVKINVQGTNIFKRLLKK